MGESYKFTENLTGDVDIVQNALIDFLLYSDLFRF